MVRGMWKADVTMFFRCLCEVVPKRIPNIGGVLFCTVIIFFLFVLIEGRTNWSQIKRRKREYIYRFLLAFFIAVFLNVTIVGRDKAVQYQFELTPFQSYMCIFRERDMYRLIENAMNIILLMPIGMLLPMCFACFKKVFRTFGITFLFVVIIESIQLFCRVGVFEVDDIIHNMVGIVGGIGLYTFVIRRYCTG